MAQKSDLYSTNNFVVTTASTDINEKLNEPYGDSNFSWASGEGSDDDFYSLEGDYSNAKGDKKSKNKAGGYADRRDKRVELLLKQERLEHRLNLKKQKQKENWQNKVAKTMVLLLCCHKI